jgi:hypothetical protein
MEAAGVSVLRKMTGPREIPRLQLPLASSTWGGKDHLRHIFLLTRAGTAL